MRSPPMIPSDTRVGESTPDPEGLEQLRPIVVIVAPVVVELADQLGEVGSNRPEVADVAPIGVADLALGELGLDRGEQGLDGLGVRGVLLGGRGVADRVVEELYGADLEDEGFFDPDLRSRVIESMVESRAEQIRRYREGE